MHYAHLQKKKEMATSARSQLPPRWSIKARSKRTSLTHKFYFSASTEMEVREKFSRSLANWVIMEVKYLGY